MPNLVKTSVAVIGLAMLSACGYDAPGMGGGDDFWLEQRSTTSPSGWDKVVLVFGYGENNYQMCIEFIDAMKERVRTAPYPAQFRCVPAK